MQMLAEEHCGENALHLHMDMWGSVDDCIVSNKNNIIVHISIDSLTFPFPRLITNFSVEFH